MALIKNAVVNSGGNPIMLQGLEADIPASGIDGRLYVAIDTLVIYRDNGSNWFPIVSGGNFANLQQVLNSGNTATGIDVILYTVGGLEFVKLDSLGGIVNQLNDATKVFVSNGSVKSLNSSFYTPIAAVTTGTVTTITPSAAKYTVVDKLVTVYGAVYLLPNLAIPPALIIFTLTLPVPIKTGATVLDLAGTGVAAGGASVNASLPYVIDYSVGANAANCFIQGIANNVYGLKYSFQYEID